MWFHHSSQVLVYQLGLEGEWLEYYPVVNTTGTIRTMRQTKVWYILRANHPSTPNPSTLLPQMIYQDPLFDDYLFYTTYSFKYNSYQLWDLDNSLHILADMPEFYP